MPKLKCSSCGYEWNYNGKFSGIQRASCPGCLHKNVIDDAQELYQKNKKGAKELELLSNRNLKHSPKGVMNNEQ